MTTPDELQRAVDRLDFRAATGAAALAGVVTVTTDDLRLLLSERAELLAAVERMRGGLEEIEKLPRLSIGPVDDFDRGARAARLNAADIARAALTTGEGK